MWFIQMEGGDTIYLFERRAMKRTVFALLGLGLLVFLNGCSRSVPGTPTPLPTLVINPSPNSVLATPSNPPVGSFDVATCTEIAGWACDPNDYNQPITINFYANGPVDAGGELVGSTIANVEREPAVGAQCGDNIAHGFKSTMPTSLQDGLPHEIYAYAVSLNPLGFNSLLQGSSKTITCSSTPIPAATAATTGGTIPGVQSGPYGVILVAAGDALNIRTGPGTSFPVSGSFSAGTTNVMRTGPSSTVNGDLWVEVQNPAGGNGWVFSDYLTEYVAPATFCTDGRVNTLLTNLDAALKTTNGESLASLVSPVHGMAVRMWRYSAPIIFDQEHARWVFDSTFSHDWGAAPGSGLETTGSFHEKVLPLLLDVFNTSYALSCNSVQTGGASYDTSWPAIYTNVNYYSLYKPGPAGNELSWRTLLIGVEYVQDQPFVYSLTQMNWEP
jgi:hypothetical protein